MSGALLFFHLISLISFELLLQPILTFNEPGDDVADHIISGGVDHGSWGSTRLPMATRMGKASSICVGKKMVQMIYSPM